MLAWGSFEAFCTVAWTRGQSCGLDFEVPLQAQVLIATRDLADATPRIDSSRVAAKILGDRRIKALTNIARKAGSHLPLPCARSAS